MYLACEFSQGLAVTGTGSCIHILNCVCVRVAEVSLIASGQHFLWDPQEFPGRLRDMFWLFLQASSQFNMTWLLTHPLKVIFLSYIFQQLKPEISRKGSCSQGASIPTLQQVLLLVAPGISSRLKAAVSRVFKHYLQPIMRTFRCFQHASCDLKKMIGLETKLFVVSPRIFSDYRCISSAPCVISFARTLLAFDSINFNCVRRAAWPHIACRHSSLAPL